MAGSADPTSSRVRDLVDHLDGLKDFATRIIDGNFKGCAELKLTKNCQIDKLLINRQGWVVERELNIFVTLTRDYTTKRIDTRNGSDVREWTVLTICIEANRKLDTGRIASSQGLTRNQPVACWICVDGRS